MTIDSGTNARIDGPLGRGNLEALLDAPPAFVDLLPVAAYACDAAGRVLWFNQRAADLWGREPRLGDDTELFCGSYKLHFDGREIGRRETPMAIALRTGEPVHGVEGIVERPDGSRTWATVHIDPVKDGSGKVLGAINCFHDTTELHRARAEAADRDARTRQILEAMPAAVYTTDAAGRITYYNEAAVRLAGRKPTLGSDEWCVTWKLYWPDGTPLPHDRCPMALALKERRPNSGMEAVAERPDGARVPFIPYPTPLFDETGALTGAVNMLVDITERKRVEEGVRRQRRILEMVATGAPLNETLDELMLMIEAQEPGMRCGILLVAGDDAHFRRGSGPHLPEEYHRALDGVPITPPYLGSCGEAAHRCLPVLMPDIAQETRYAAEWRSLMLSCGIRAGRSTPIRGADGRVLGSLAMYYDHPRNPDPADPALVEMATHLAAIAIEHERTQDALRESEKRMRELFQQAPGFMCILVGPDHVFEFANESYIRLVGRRDLLGKPLREAIPEAVEGGFLDALGRVYRTGEPFTGFETAVLIRRAPGMPPECRYVNFIYQPIKDARGAVTGIFVEGSDVTDRVTARAALREQEAESQRQKRLYEAILTNTPDLAYVFDLDHRFSYANEGLLRMWGRTWDEAIGKNCLELGYPQWHAAMHDNEIEQVIATKRPVRGQVPFSGSFGRRIYDYIFVPVLGPDGTIEAVAGTTRDITEQGQREEALRESEERYRTLFESIDEGFCILERVEAESGAPADFRYVATNPSFAAHTGVGEVVGRTIRESFPDEPSYWFETYEKVLQTGEPVRFQHPLVGQGRMLELYAFPLVRNGQGRLGVIFQDITARKQAEEGMRQRLEDMQRLNRLSQQVLRHDDLEAMMRDVLAAAAELLQVGKGSVQICDGRGQHLHLAGAIGFDTEFMDRFQVVQPQGVTTCAAALRRRQRVIVEDLATDSDFAALAEAIAPYGIRAAVSTPLLDSGGSPIAMLSVYFDRPYRPTERELWLLDLFADLAARQIERRRHLERQELLIHELNHRVKNTLATVQSLATQSLRKAASVAEGCRSFEQRLIALSKSHDVLTREHWEGAGLNEVVAGVVAAYRGGDGQACRIAADGPALRLQPKAALALSMALHELATNAVKYGALSNHSGRVDIRWRLLADGEERFHLCWREDGGPPVATPRRRGFGSRLIERGLAEELMGEVALSFPPEGLVCTIEAPMREIGERRA